MYACVLFSLSVSVTNAFQKGRTVNRDNPPFAKTLWDALYIKAVLYLEQSVLREDQFSFFYVAQILHIGFKKLYGVSSPRSYMLSQGPASGVIVICLATSSVRLSVAGCFSEPLMFLGHMILLSRGIAFREKPWSLPSVPQKKRGDYREASGPQGGAK